MPAEIVASDVEGTLSTGAQHRGIGRYLRIRGQGLAYRLLFARYIPRGYAARFGLADVQKFRDLWVHDLAALFRGWTETQLAALGEWVVEHELWPGRRESVLAELAAAEEAPRERIAIAVELLERVDHGQREGAALEVLPDVLAACPQIKSLIRAPAGLYGQPRRLPPLSSSREASERHLRRAT